MPDLSRRLGTSPRALRRDLQYGSDPYLRLRRGGVLASLIGIAAMAATTLLQTGLVRRLPEPSCRSCDTWKVNTSDEAYSYGGPDSPLAIAGHGVNLALATTGDRHRPERQPWLPLLATLTAAGQAAVAAKYLFHTMPKVDRAWCPYCVVGALAHFATVALTLPEASAALRRLARNR